MKFSVSDLWRPTGTVDRGTYAVVGIVGFAIKHNLDRLLATVGFHRPWSVFNYLEPVKNVSNITQISHDDAKFLATLVAVSLPFIWIGITMTLKRLRGVGAPAALLILFFVPVLNLLLFLTLCLVPERRFPGEPVGHRTRSWVEFFPESSVGSAALATFITGLVGAGVAAFGTIVLVNYGWGLFVALPFTIGFVAAALHGIRQPRSMSACLVVANTSVLLLGLALLAFAAEGAVCLMMAVPLAFPLATAGGAFGFFVQKRWNTENTAPAFLAALLFFTPGVQWIEHVIARSPEVFVVHSSIEVNATPERVWKQVIAFSEIGPPKEMLFRVGIAYPLRAEIIGSGPGAERHCVFSTGAFVEPIQVWDEPRQLKFSVTQNPPPMEEWTPYHHIEPPHLRGFLKSEGGEFLLTELPNGRTRLEGVTWYQHGLWPSQYWRVWSDHIIHSIHMRVLTHIKTVVETAV